MTKFLSFIFELLRIMILFFLGLMLLGTMETWIYNMFDEQILQQSVLNRVLLLIANILIIFSLYRSRWQFSGWYKSEKNVKLSKRTTRIIAGIAIVLFLIPAVLHVYSMYSA